MNATPKKPSRKRAPRKRGGSLGEAETARTAGQQSVEPAGQGEVEPVQEKLVAGARRALTVHVAEEQWLSGEVRCRNCHWAYPCLVSRLANEVVMGTGVVEPSAGLQGVVLPDNGDGAAGGQPVKRA